MHSGCIAAATAGSRLRNVGWRVATWKRSRAASRDNQVREAVGRWTRRNTVAGEGGVAAVVPAAAVVAVGAVDAVAVAAVQVEEDARVA